MRRDPYNRIMDAAKDGAGVNLNAEEVRAMSADPRIEARAGTFVAWPERWQDEVRNAKPKPRYFGPGA